MATWDDHDFGVNDSRGAEITDWKRRKSRRLFHKYLGRSINSNRPEIYCAFEIDDVKIILLDVRYYRQRAHPSRPNATLLGEKQEQWLWDELRHDKKYTVIGSGSCIKDGAKRETWRDFKSSSPSSAIGSRTRIAFSLSRAISTATNSMITATFSKLYPPGSAEKERLGKYPNQKNGKPLNNYGIITFGKTNVRVSLRGRRKKDRTEKPIQTSGWKLID